MDLWSIKKSSTTKKPDASRSIRLCNSLADLPPEVGAEFFDEALLYPAADDGLYHRRLVVGEAKTHEVLLCELLGQGIQIADVSLGSLRTQSPVVEGVNLLTIDL